MNHDEQKKLADDVTYEQLLKKVERMRQLVSIDGFIKAYYNLLKDCESNKQAFDMVNDEYFELFGVYRYSDLDSFRNTIKKRK